MATKVRLETSVGGVSAAVLALRAELAEGMREIASFMTAERSVYALHRAWCYYLDALRPEVLAEENRNGHIDRKLSFPLEDLYHHGQPAGQVGQEIYGAGAAFVFASRSFHPVEGAPFRIFCDHFLLESERTSEHSLSLQLSGGATCDAVMSIVRLSRRKLPKVTLSTANGDRVRPRRSGAERIDYVVPADARVTLQWTDVALPATRPERS